MFTKWVTAWCLTVRAFRERIVVFRERWVRACTKWSRNAFRQCAQWADQGFNQCAQWGTEISKRCGRRWRWLCRLVVWVVVNVCRLVVWVAQLVCVIVVWVVRLVCVVFAWIVFIVAWVLIRIWLIVTRKPCEAAGKDDLVGTVRATFSIVLIVLGLFGGAALALHQLDQGSTGATMATAEAPGVAASGPSPEPTAPAAEEPATPTDATEAAQDATEPSEAAAEPVVPVPTPAPANPPVAPSTEVEVTKPSPEPAPEDEPEPTPPTTTPPAVPMAQTIEFAQPGNVRFTGGAVQQMVVSATASSGLAVTFTTTTPAVCVAEGTNGSAIRLVGYGTCTVVAGQAGDDSYSAATPVTRSFAVTD
ncbi:MAG: hypothetical protein ACRD12_15015 [Acidimicrobiales bacterium]